LAYANSKDLVPSAQLTAGNITYIKNTLSNEREKLLTEINVIYIKFRKSMSKNKKLKNFWHLWIKKVKKLN
jgi:hypothetical protein